ncbi:universal stress protein [Streptomyces sp. NPDC004111]|uniref:universal stress protein n=1 Tax=Streptomyces sp. NPDC004111 TaxID=3364690 RepID=UPI003676FB4F
MDNLPVITAVDGSDHSLRALEWALAAARSRGTELLVAHIRTDHTKALPMAGSVPILPPVDSVPLLTHVQEQIEAREDSAELPPVRYETVDGSPGSGLVALSERGQLLVLGSRGRGGFASLLLGSVSRACTARAACPVVVVPHAARTEEAEAAKADGPAPVVLGFSLEETSDVVVEFAFEEAKRRGAPLQVITTYPVPLSTLALMGGDIEGAGATGRPEIEADLRETQSHRLRPFVQRYEEVQVQQVVAASDAAGRLVVASQTAGLLVVGRHRRRLSADTFLGSAANAVLQHAHCPVAVVPPQPASPLG